MTDEVEAVLDATCAAKYEALLLAIQEFVTLYDGCATFHLEVKATEAVSDVVSRELAPGQTPVMTSTALILPGFISAPILTNRVEYTEHAHADVVRKLALCPLPMRAFYTVTRDVSKQEWLSALILRIAALPNRLSKLCAEALTAWIGLSEQIRQRANSAPSLADTMVQSLADFGTSTGPHVQRIVGALLAELLDEAQQELMAAPHDGAECAVAVTVGQLRATLMNRARCATLLGIEPDRVDLELLRNEMSRMVPPDADDETAIVGVNAQLSAIDSNDDDEDSEGGFVETDEDTE